MFSFYKKYLFHNLVCLSAHILKQLPHSVAKYFIKKKMSQVTETLITFGHYLWRVSIIFILKTAEFTKSTFPKRTKSIVPFLNRYATHLLFSFDPHSISFKTHTKTDFKFQVSQGLPSNSKILGITFYSPVGDQRNPNLLWNKVAVKLEVKH